VTITYIQVYINKDIWKQNTN